ncbi:MAG: hypothetical protein WC581_06975 [Thermodesulfovibrionales bacterium]
MRKKSFICMNQTTAWRKAKILGFAVVIFIFLNCNAIGEWQKNIGKEVVFSEGDNSLIKYGYTGLCRTPDPCLGLPYNEYVGKRGRIVGLSFAHSKIHSYWEILLETGEVVYSTRSDISDKVIGMYYVDDYNKAKELIGKFIWINQEEGVRRLELITEDKDISYPLAHLEKVKVIDVYLKRIGHSYGAMPFFLKVQKASGEIGLIGYRVWYFSEKDSIDNSWRDTQMDITAVKYTYRLSSFLGDLVILHDKLLLNSMEFSRWIRMNIHDEEDEKELRKLSSEESNLKSNIEKAMRDKDSLKLEAFKHYNGHMPTVLVETWAELESNYSDYIREDYNPSSTVRKK